jgi:Cu+-exporting ATPase
LEETVSNETNQTTLQISGMTCAACASRIEKGLGKLSGVTNAVVNFAMKTARVEYSTGEISISDM